MKKLIIGLSALILLLGLAFFWLVSGASADNAPKDTLTIELDAP